MKKLLFTLFLGFCVSSIQAQSFNSLVYSDGIDQVNVIGSIEKSVIFPKDVSEVSVTVDISTLFPNNYYITSCLCPIASSNASPISRLITFTFLRSHAFLAYEDMGHAGPLPGEIYFAPKSGTTDKKIIRLKFNLDFID
nr:hypothetical protein [uncultured Bacteroides sp.]